MCQSTIFIYFFRLLNKLSFVVLFKVIQCGYETLQNVKSALENHVAKAFNLELNLLLNSNKALNLHFIIFSKINTTLVTNKRLL